MSHLRKIKLLVVFTALVAVMDINAQPAQTIPEFTLFKKDKTAFTNKDLDKQKMLFFLFFDVTCEHCLHAVQTINKRYPEMSNTFIHLITLDKPEEVDLFLKKHGKNLLNKTNVMLYFDLRNEFITKFKPRKYPSIFLYSPQQKLILYTDDPAKLPAFFDEISKGRKNKK